MSCTSKPPTPSNGKGSCRTRVGTWNLLPALLSNRISPLRVNGLCWPLEAVGCPGGLREKEREELSTRMGRVTRGNQTRETPLQTSMAAS